MTALSVAHPSHRAARSANVSRRVGLGISSLSIAALLTFGAVVPAQAATGDPAESTSQFVTASGINLHSADIAGSYASTPSGPGNDSATFSPATYNALTDTVALLAGGFGEVPLVYDTLAHGGLLAINQSNVFGYSEAPSILNAFSANGAIDPATGAFTELSNGDSIVNFDAAFDALGVSNATRHVLSQIDLELGTMASQAQAGAYTGTIGDYRLEGASLELTSPLLTELPGLINVALEEATLLAQQALEATAPGGVIPLPAGTIPDVPVSVGTLEVGDVSLLVTAPNFDSVVSTVMSNSVVLTSDDGIATVVLNTGEIHIDLAPLYGGSLNGLPANTEVFTPANMATISNAVANALSKTTAIFAAEISNALHATQLGMSVDVAFRMAPSNVTTNLNNLVVAAGTLSGSGSLDDFADGTSVFTSAFVQEPGLPACARPPIFGACPLFMPTSTVVGGAITVINTTVPTIAPPAIAVIATPLMAALVQVEAEVLAEVEPVVADVYGQITSAFDWLMPTLARLVVNEQPTTGDLGAGSFTVRAASVTMLPSLPGSSQAHLSLASSTVLAIADPRVNINETQIAPKSTVTINGSGWNPQGGPVTLSFINTSSATVGAPFSAVLAADGTISATWVVPAGTSNGLLTLTASQDNLSRTDTVNVYAAVTPALPSTGAQASLVPLGVAGAALLSAGVVLLASRKRRSVQN